MVDTVTPQKRSWMMSQVKGRNTSPEMLVRRTLHAMGYRYRLHDKNLPGSPDIVFKSRKSVVFVHGCFWHRHDGCNKATTPKTRQEFWQNKFDRNVERDKSNIQELQDLGWKAMVVWECETKDLEALSVRLTEFLGCPSGLS